MHHNRFNRTNWLSASYAPVRVFYGGGKSQQSSSQVSVPPEILAQYQNVNSIANQTAQTPFTQYSTDPNAFVAPLDSTQQAGILGTNQYSTTAQPFYQAASNQNQASTSTGQGLISGASGLNSAATTGGQAGLAAAAQATGAASSPVTTSQIQNYENPYLSDVINPTSQLLQQQYNQAQSGQLGNAINQGAFGGDRSAVAAANLQQQQSLAYGQTIGGLENQNYSQALGEANTEQQAGLQGANQIGQLSAQYGQLGQAGANNQAQYGSASGQLGQAGANNEANIGSGAQSAGLAGAQAQLTAGQAQQQTEQAGETALYNQFLQQQSYPFQTTQFLANIAEGTGALSGSTTNSSQPAPFFSDERLKEDMQSIGKTHDGLNIYKFKYKGDKQTHVGLSAQEVERHHPEAVGLAGGYKTVDYDAATRNAAGLGGRNGVRDNSVDARKHRDAGGGFALDPSYLEAQQQAYASAPWGNAGVGVGGAPYGGKSHVPPSAGGGHAQLATAKAPAMSTSGGLGDITKNLGQIESFGKEGKTLWDDAKGSNVLSGLAGKLGLGTPPVGAPAPVQPASPSVPHNEPQPAGGGSVATPIPDPSAGRANAAQLAGAGGLGDMGSDADLGDSLGDMFASRGGLMHRDAGGATYQDAADDDASAGGDVPYDSGTGMKGLSVPDDKPHNSLPTAQTPSSSSGGGLGDVLGDVGKVAGFVLPFLKRGGRVGLASGGDPGDGSDPMLAMPDAASFQKGNAAPAQAAILAKHAAPDIVVPPTVTRQPVAPKGGLNPDAPSPDAHPVQAQQEQQDMGAGSGAPMHQTQPGEVLTQDNPGGVGDFLNKNQGLLVPLLHGLGSMASSNSRYLGSAVLQGLGGAADSYENVQNEMQTRLGNQPIVQQRQNDASNSDLNLYQSMINQRPELANLTFAQFEQLKASGKLNSYQGASPGAPNGAGDGYKYTVQEKNTGVNAQGVALSQDPAYLAKFAAKNAGIQSPFVQGQVHQANDQAVAVNSQQFTYDKNGNQVTLPGMNSRVMAQNEPNVQTAQGGDFRKQKTDFLNSYGPTQSLLQETGQIFQQMRSGPTADVKARLAKLANDLDPQGKIPALHGLTAASSGEDYDTAMKDIAQITAQRLTGMSKNAPDAEIGLLNQYAANPDKSPGTLRDLVIRQQALLQQQHDYYRGYDPFKSNKSVDQYTDDFYETNPYEKYRGALEKTTPTYAGQQPNARNQPGATAAPSAPVTLNANDPNGHYNSLPSGSRFVGPDGKVRVKP